MNNFLEKKAFFIFCQKMVKNEISSYGPRKVIVSSNMDRMGPKGTKEYISNNFWPNWPFPAEL